ncbi:uncharacterized protein BX664DRAFT_339179 [Halteromyces radiatus]|uniref:uncharacterized protein n=1 Tax=Halteromyces radiatus TaxID=101107 RepID=UPI00221E7EB0|nr:uncharacterized protein BX664DRAFT_339179 [Halteromyces radiatus]KAI8082836.1 hypothetical protein BX664DRAFT_339179 [Halteromyces radiatus]
MVRFKCRWILFELVQDPLLQHDKPVEQNIPLQLADNMIQKALRVAITSTFGEYGGGLLRAAHVKWYNPETGTGIIRAPREHASMLLAALFFIKQLESIPCHFRTLQVSGTLIFIQKAAIDRDRSLYLKEQMRMEQLGKTYSVVDRIEKCTIKVNSITL